MITKTKNQKKSKDLNSFQEFMLWFLDITFGKLFTKWENEDAEARFNKSRNIKTFNISLIITLIVCLLLFYLFKI